MLVIIPFWLFDLVPRGNFNDFKSEQDIYDEKKNLNTVVNWYKITNFLNNNTQEMCEKNHFFYALFIPLLNGVGIESGFK